MEITTKIVDGVKYARLYVSPFTANIPTSSERVFWQHASSCQGNIFIGDDASCYCDKCNIRSHIRNWTVFPYSDNTSSDVQVELDSRVPITISGCTALAGEMVKVCGISWLKSFLDGLTKPTSDSDYRLVMRPYQGKEENEAPIPQQNGVADTLEDSLEDGQENTNNDIQTEHSEPDSPDMPVREENPNSNQPERPNNDNEVDNLDIDISSFDESTFFERFSEKNSK